MADSFTLADIYNDMEFDCNAGLARMFSVGYCSLDSYSIKIKQHFLESTRHWDCIQKVHANKDYINHADCCLKQYQYSLKRNPNKFCDYAESFSFCITIAYQNVPECFFKDVSILYTSEIYISLTDYVVGM